MVRNACLQQADDSEEAQMGKKEEEAEGGETDGIRPARTTRLAARSSTLLSFLFLCLSAFSASLQHAALSAIQRFSRYQPQIASVRKEGRGEEKE